MEVQALQTKIFREGDNLPNFITNYIKNIRENSIIVITSKIVAIAEGQVAGLKKGKEYWIRKESDWAIKTKYTWLTVKDGTVMASAGIDESNANGKFILLPKDSFRSAQILRRKLKRYYKLKNLGILITDSRVFPLRSGVVGVALGYAGFRGLRDYRGSNDIFGRRLTMTQTNIADSLATAAVLIMGEGSEQTPLGIITQAPVVFKDGVNKKELLIAPRDDMYLPLFKLISRK